jgi:hypothetical protein
MAKNEDKVKDKLIEDLLVVVENKKAEIERIKNPVFKTNLSLTSPYNESVRINLNVAGEETLLSLLYIFERMVSDNGTIPAKYGVPSIEDWYGFKLEDWRSDLVLKIKQKSAQRQIKDLKEKEEKLNSLISERKKKEIELDNLKASLGL